MGASLVAANFFIWIFPERIWSAISARRDTLARLYRLDSGQLVRTESEAERSRGIKFKDCGIVRLQEALYFGRGRVGLL